MNMLVSLVDHKWTSFLFVLGGGGGAGGGGHIVPCHLNSRDATLRWCYVTMMLRYK